VALLYDLSRQHFALESADERLDNNQLADGDLFQTDNGSAYTVKVKFNCEITGFFSQRVIFDFGCRPVVGRTLSVDMHSTEQHHDRVVSLQRELQFVRWTSDNCRVVGFDETTAVAGSDLDAKVLEKYRLPSDINAIINTETINSELNRNNYSRRMHSLLSLEEFTRMKIISRYVSHSLRSTHLH